MVTQFFVTFYEFKQMSVSASQQYRMISVGLNDNDTQIQVVGPNLNCSSTISLIPLFKQLEDNLPNYVDKFLTVSVAFSLDTSTLVVCGGVQSKVYILLFVFIDHRRLVLA